MFNHLLLIAFLLLSVPTYSYIQGGDEIWDLVKTDQTCFALEAAAWTVSKYQSGTSLPYTSCNGIFLLGGASVLGSSWYGSGKYGQSGQYFERQYNNLPSHESIRFAFTFYAIDSWDPDDSWEFSFDDKKVTGWAMSTANFASNVCGGYWKDLPNVRIFGRRDHDKSTLKFRVTSKNDEASDNESFGIRDIHFSLTNDDEGDKLCQISTLSSMGDKCGCDEGKYKNGGSCSNCNNKCLSCWDNDSDECYQCKATRYFDGEDCDGGCDSSCATCKGGGSSDCTSCPTTTMLFGNKCQSPSLCISPLVVDTCNNACNAICDTSKFLYWNGSCLNSCNPPLQQTTTSTTLGNMKQCNYPCTSSSDYLYNNNSCIASCPAPFISKTEGGKKFCVNPCYGTSNPWLYWNSTCKSGCASPLSQRTEGGNQICDYPCPNANQYLYWDQSCETQCDSPLVTKTEAGKKYCIYKCTGSQNLYPDGTCSGTCTGTSTTVKGKDFCQPGCSTGEFLYWNGTCLPDCDPPLTQSVDGGGKDVCQYTCSSGQFLYWDKSCSSSCSSPYTPVTEGGKQFCPFPCPSGKILDWDGTCVTSCDTDMNTTPKGTESICEFKCTTSQYPVLDGTCVNSCNLPYTLKYHVNRYFCDFYCVSGVYLDYPSISCVVSCPPGYYEDTPTRSCKACQMSNCDVCLTYAGAKCDQCEDENILDNNGLCQDCEEMDITYLKSTKTGHQYTLKLIPKACNLDASFVQQYLEGTQEAKNKFPTFSFQVTKTGNGQYTVDLIIQGSTIEALDLDVTLKYLTGTMKVPKTLEVSATVQKLQEMGGTATTALTAASASSAVGILAMGASAALWNMINFQQFIGYFIYINVDYPPQTELFLSLFQFANFDFLPNPFARFTEWMTDGVDSLKDTNIEKYQPPQKFVKYEGTSFFVDNGGAMLSTCLGLVILVFVSKVLMRVRLWRIDNYATKIYVFLKWNVVLRSFLESGIPLALSIFLQIRRVSYNSFYAAFSVVLASVSFIYFLCMIHFSLDILGKKNEVELEKKAVKNLYGTLYEGIALKSEAGKYYHLLVLLRGVLLIFLIAFFEINPWFQIIPLIIYNIGLLIYLCKAASFEERGMNIVGKIRETFILFGEIGILLLNVKANYPEYYSDVGWAIVFFLGMALVVELGYTLVLQIIGFKLLYKNLVNFISNMKKLVNKETQKTRGKRVRRKIHRPIGPKPSHRPLI